MLNIKKVRIEKQLTQQQVADASGVKVGVLRHYEQGSKNIDTAKLETLLNICGALGCNLVDILEDEKLKEKLKTRC